jgi:hypothetical protein
MIGCKQGILNSYCAFVKQNILVAQYDQLGKLTMDSKINIGFF